MNTLGLTLLGSIAHATGFAMVGMLAYLALRRLGPAAGSLAAGASLLIMSIVALVALGPWPRWWTFAPEDLASAGRGDPRAAPPLELSPPARDGAERSPRPTAALPAASSPSEPRGPISLQPDSQRPMCSFINCVVRAGPVPPKKSPCG